MTYLSEESKVIYESKEAQKEKLFEALEWLAAICSHIPDRALTDGPILKILQHY